MNHDIDRTQVGFGPEPGGFAGRSGGTVFAEDEQETLANGLMDVNSEEELEYFLGDVISGATDAVGKFVSSPTGQAVIGGLKDVAKTALPLVGQWAGSRFGPAGSQIGQALGTGVAGLLHEMAAPEELEWEAANGFVKLAAEAAKNAAEAPPGADPHAVAKKAIIEAAKIHAPGLVGPLASGALGVGEAACHCGGAHYHYHHRHHHHSGYWYRHGKKIVLVGV
jgi:hypothetical protein